LPVRPVALLADISDEGRAKGVPEIVFLSLATPRRVPGNSLPMLGRSGYRRPWAEFRELLPRG